MTNRAASESTVVDLDELEALVRACPNDTGMGYCEACSYAIGQCTCATRYQFRYATKKPVVLALIQELRAHREREATGKAITHTEAGILLDAMRYPDNGALYCRWCAARQYEGHDAHCWSQDQVRKVDAARALVDELMLSNQARAKAQP